MGSVCMAGLVVCFFICFLTYLPRNKNTLIIHPNLSGSRVRPKDWARLVGTYKELCSFIRIKVLGIVDDKGIIAATKQQRPHCPGLFVQSEERIGSPEMGLWPRGIAGPSQAPSGTSRSYNNNWGSPKRRSSVGATGQLARCID